MRRDRWHFGSSVAPARFDEANRAFHVAAAARPVHGAARMPRRLRRVIGKQLPMTHPTTPKGGGA
jgi:hypothetical protein